MGYGQLHGPAGCHEAHGICTAYARHVHGMCTACARCMCMCTASRGTHAHARRHSGLRHLRLHSQRPPPACAAEQDCQHRFRDHAMIYVDPSALRVALADAAAPAPAVGRDANHVVARGAGRRAGRGAGRGTGRGAGRDASCEDAVGWVNLFGRGCADYSRRGKASAAGVSSPTAGGPNILLHYVEHPSWADDRLVDRWDGRQADGRIGVGRRACT